MYDQRLRPLTDRYQTSHGLPSLETHMATVVAGWWAESGGNGSGVGGANEGGQPLVRLLAVGYICFVGFTRFVLKSWCLSSVRWTVSMVIKRQVCFRPALPLWWIQRSVVRLRRTETLYNTGSLIVPYSANKLALQTKWV